MLNMLGFHSEFTISRSSIKINDLKKFKDSPIAICDNGNISGLIKLLGINKKNIPSVELYVVNSYSEAQAPRQKARFFCFDLNAYKSMCKMIDIANKNFHYSPRISLNDLVLDGDIRVIVYEEFEYLNDFPKDKIYIAVNAESNIANPIYITKQSIYYHDVYCFDKKDLEKIKILSARNFEHQNRVWLNDEEHYQVASLLPESIKNYNKFINDASEVLKFDDKYPVFSDNSELLFDALVDSGFSRKYPNPTKEEVNRLEYEKTMIKKMGFCDYFLITWDFIDWSRRNDIPIGPGRGSAAGSIVSYCLDITKLDPVKNGLYFERFLNPERISPPDIDTDINADDREKIVKYINQRYGKEYVSQIITFGVLKSRSAFKDACRLAGVEAEEANRITGFFPPNKFGITPTLDECYGVDTVKNWVAQNNQNKTAWDQAKSIEGFTRQTGVHAAGFILSPFKLNEITGLSYADDVSVCQWDKNDSEKFGLLKMDFLGLQTLGLIKNTCKLLGKSYYDMEKIPLDDDEVYNAFRIGDTHGIFQFESNGMKKLLKRIVPTSFADIAAATALYRPGPLMAGLTDMFVKNKHSENRSYIIPEFEDLMNETYGVFVYQEQVMKLAQEIAGFSLPKADTLRKAIGKKDKKIMEKLETEFISGAVNNGQSEEKMIDLWQQILGFADYCFNKSHSYAYALLSYWSMYLKVHYPTQFAISLLSSDMKDNVKMQTNFFELQGKVEFLPPLIDNAKEEFSSIDNKVMIGLGCIKGIGNEAMKIAKNQPYSSIVDVAIKNNLDKTRMLHLIYCGAFDSYEKDKSLLVGNYERILAHGKSNKESDFFTLFDPSDAFSLNYNLRKKIDTEEVIEKEAYGYNIFHGFIIRNSWLVKSLNEDTIIGNVSAIKRTKTKKNQEDMAILTVDTINGRLAVPVFPKYYEKFALYLNKDKTYVFQGEKLIRANLEGEDEESFAASDFIPIEDAKISHVAIYAPIEYNLNWLINFLEPKIISEGDTTLVLHHNDEYGWSNVGEYPRKIMYTKEIHESLLLHGIDIVVNIFR